MKKWIALFSIVVALAACNSEPKLDQTEETAVESQLNADQKAMDSLEASIMAQMDAINGDSSEMDSL
ncbi:MAG: hypothetical protein SGJ00_04450 [bacterium]|nr:hypothetical protein [bacterium]